MDWQGALRARLTAAAPVTALVGQRIYWEQVPQGTALPYVTLLDGTAGIPQTLSDWDLAPSRVQIDVWTATYAEKQAITAALLVALVPGSTSNGHIFQRAEVAMGPRDIGGETDGLAPVFRKHMDLIIHHKPA